MMKFNNRMVKENWKKLSGYEETKNIDVLLRSRKEKRFAVKITDEKNKIIVGKNH